MVAATEPSTWDISEIAAEALAPSDQVVEWLAWDINEDEKKDTELETHLEAADSLWTDFGNL
jgi:hypothetical protein